MKTAVINLESICAKCSQQIKSRKRAEAAERELAELWAIAGGAERFLPGYKHGKNLYESFVILVATLVGTYDVADRLCRIVETHCGRCFVAGNAETWCEGCSLAAFSQRIRREARWVISSRIPDSRFLRAVPSDHSSTDRIRKWERVCLTDSVYWQRTSWLNPHITIRIPESLGAWRSLLDGALEQQGYHLNGSLSTHEGAGAVILHEMDKCEICAAAVGYHGPCLACALEAQCGTEEDPHPVPARLHSCVRHKSVPNDPPPIESRTRDGKESPKSPWRRP